MKYLDEYRDGALTRKLLDEIASAITRPWKLMEVCGGQTHSILKSGLDQLLPSEVDLVHGPGCPVCVTPLELIDKALALAARPDVIFASYGDMLRVPGSERDLFSVKAAGGDVRIVYSPLDSLKYARENPDKVVVFFGIGFETTAPANAMAVAQAKDQGIENFAMLVSHVTVPPAISGLMQSPDVRVDGFLAAGHVCTVMGYWEYEPLAKKHNVPIVVTGFEPVDITRGVLMCVEQLEEGRAEVENAYARSVRREGNPPAQEIINQVFEPCDRPWRGIGVIPQSGYRSNDSPKCRRLPRRSRNCVSADWCCRVSRSPMSAPPLEWSVRLRCRWVRRWSPPKGRVQPTTTTGATPPASRRARRRHER
jgi:hydrogenase expression/formation protein HypD